MKDQHHSSQDQENGSWKRKFSWSRFREAARIFRYMWPYRAQFAVGMVLLFLSSLIVMVFPYLAGLMTDIATGEADLPINLNQVAILLGVILVVQGLISFFRVILFTLVSEKGMANVRKALYEKLITLPIVFFEKTRVGELTSRISADVVQLQSVFAVTLAEFIRQILILIVGITFLLLTTPRLSLIMLGTFPIVVVAAIFFGRFIRRMGRERQAKLADANVVVDETMQTIHTVKSFSNEGHEYKRYGNKIAKVVHISMLLAKYRASFSTFIIVALFGGIFFLLWFGATLVESGQMTVGQLVSFVAYTGFIGGAIGGLGNFYAQLVAAVGSTERIREILNEENETSISFSPQSAQVPRIDATIEFHDVHFAYPTRTDIEVLKGINLRVEAGEKIALVGPSGVGKSTIAQLILRFYEIDRGQILVGGKDIYSYDIQEYRSMLGLVPQEVLLFGGTIRENILYGDPTADEERIIEAAKKANAWEFISSFPEQLETIVGERGIKLSGGQRQRVAIARAILRNPKILILDEATSSLDAESEKVVQDALNTLMEGRTSVIIAHRLSTIRNADCIYVLENGQVVESGTHDELSSVENGAYQNLAKLQFELS